MDGLLDVLSKTPVVEIQPQKAVEWVSGRSKLQLSVDQVIALEGLLSAPVTILYGGPGTGKTTLLRAYADIVAMKTKKIGMHGTTEKAAKRHEQVGR